MHLQDSDYGFGEYDEGTGTIICERRIGKRPTYGSWRKSSGFVPTTTGSNYCYSSYNGVWDKQDRAPLPSKLERADSNRDNGMKKPTGTLEPNTMIDYSLVTSLLAEGQVAVTDAMHRSRVPTPPRRAPSA